MTFLVWTLVVPNINCSIKVPLVVVGQKTLSAIKSFPLSITLHITNITLKSSNGMRIIAFYCYLLPTNSLSNACHYIKNSMVILIIFFIKMGLEDNQCFHGDVNSNYVFWSYMHMSSF